MRSIVFCGGLLLLSMLSLYGGDPHCLESAQVQCVSHGNFEEFVRDRCSRERQNNPDFRLYVFLYRNGCYHALKSFDAYRDSFVDSFFVLDSHADLCEACMGRCEAFDVSSLE